MNKLAKSTYEESKALIYSDEQTRVFNHVCGEGYDPTPKQKMRFDIACALVGEFELDPNPNRYISQRDLLRLLECSNPAYLELRHKNYENQTAKKTQKEPLSMIVGQTIVQFFPYCGGQRLYRDGDNEFLIYPLQPKLRGANRPNYEGVLFPETHLTKQIDPNQESGKKLAQIKREKVKLMSSYAAEKKELGLRELEVLKEFSRSQTE